MHFPDQALAIRLEKSLARDMQAYIDAFKHHFPDVKVESHHIGGGVAICMGDSFINTAVGIGLDTPVTHADLDSLEAFYDKHSINPSIEVCPFTDASFLQLLNARGYHLTRFITAYHHPLTDLHPPANLNHNIIVKPIAQDENNIWVDTVMDVTSTDKHIDTRLAQAVTHRPHTTCFLAWHDGNPIGASALSIRDGLATLYFTATRQAYREQGVQTAMIHARLAYAQSKGCDMAFATTIPGNHSMRNVMRAGFQVGYTRCMMEKPEKKVMSDE